MKSIDGVFHTSVFPQATQREIVIKGSLFRYANAPRNGSYNEFTFTTAMETIARFSDEVQQPPQNILLSRCESGWNTVPDHSSIELLDGFMLLENKSFSGDENIRKFSFHEHLLKFYLKDIIEKEKGFIFPVNSIRIEQSLRGSLMNREYKINSLKNLQNRDVYYWLHQRLIAQLEKVVFFDNSINVEVCSNKNRQFILESACNPTYWKNIAGLASQTYQLSKNGHSEDATRAEYERVKKQFQRKKKMLREFGEKYGSDLRSSLVKSLNNEFERFMSQ